MYARGEGVEKSQQEAVNWFRAASAQNHPNAQFNLGLCYADGRGVEKDGREAVRWFRAAAVQGQSLAHFNLGLCYMNGTGVDEDELVSACFFQIAIVSGYPEAKQELDNLKLNEVLCNMNCSLIFHSSNSPQSNQFVVSLKARSQNL